MSGCTRLGWKLSEPARVFLDSPVGDIGQRLRSWLRKRGSDSQGRLCLIVRSWELAVFFF